MHELHSLYLFAESGTRQRNHDKIIYLCVSNSFLSSLINWFGWYQHFFLNPLPSKNMSFLCICQYGYLSAYHFYQTSIKLSNSTEHSPFFKIDPPKSKFWWHPCSTDSQKRFKSMPLLSGSRLSKAFRTSSWNKNQVCDKTRLVRAKIARSRINVLN